MAEWSWSCVRPVSGPTDDGGEPRFECDIFATDGTWKVVWTIEVRNWLDYWTGVSITSVAGDSTEIPNLSQPMLHGLDLEEARWRALYDGQPTGQKRVITDDDALGYRLWSNNFDPPIDLSTAPVRRGPPSKSTEHHFKVALRYLSEQKLQQERRERGEPRDGGVLEGMRRHFIGDGDPAYLAPGPPFQTIRTWVRKATDAGYLSSPGQGKRHRRPGPRFWDGELPDSPPAQPSHLDALRAAIEAAQVVPLNPTKKRGKA